MDLNGVLLAYLLTSFLLSALFIWLGFGRFTSVVLALVITMNGIIAWLGDPKDWLRVSDQGFAGAFIFILISLTSTLLIIWLLWLLITAIFGLLITT